jgi:periplasmic mercuric ion binding protein
MKKIAIVLLLFSFSAFAKDIHISVKGMVCGFCAQGIEKKFKAMPEVDKVEVSLEKKTVFVKTKENKDISDETIKQVLSDAGYNVGEIKR